MTKTNMTNSEEDQFNESLITLLNSQHNLQKQSLDRMKNMSFGHKYDSLMRDFPTYDDKSTELGDWLLQIEKVALLTNSHDCEIGVPIKSVMGYPPKKFGVACILLHGCVWVLDQRL